MTRRPRSRLPPRLPDPAHDRVPARPKVASPRELLKDAHVAGRSARFTQADVMETMRAIVRGDVTTLLGLPPFTALTLEHTEAAAKMVFGWDGDGPRARIDPRCTERAFRAACARVGEVAGLGGRLAFATSRPASLLGLHRALAEAATRVGGHVLCADQSGPIGADSRRLWWIDQVAVVTDGENLLADASPEAADELLFVLPRPDLVVADHVFAGAAASAGLDVVAFADLDAMALAVAAWRGMSVRAVPLDEHRFPQAYAPLLSLLDETFADPSVVSPDRSHASPSSGTLPRLDA